MENKPILEEIRENLVKFKTEDIHIPDVLLEKIIENLKISQLSFAFALNELEFFENYLAIRLEKSPNFIECVAALFLITKNQPEYTNLVISNRKYEDILCKMFTKIIEEFFNNSPPLKNIDLLSELIEFYLKGIDQPDFYKISAFLLNFSGLSICLHLSKNSMKQFLLNNIDIVPEWKKMLKTAKNIYNSPDSTFILNLLQTFWQSLSQLNNNPEKSEKLIYFCQKFLQLLVALILHSKTSLFIKSIITDHNVLILLKNSKIMNLKEGAILDKQRDLLDFYMNCSNKNQEEKISQDNEKLGLLFKIMYKYFGDRLNKTSTQFVGKLNSKENLEELLSQLDEDETNKLCIYLGIPRPSSELTKMLFGEDINYSDILKEIIKNYYDDTIHNFKEIMDVPMFPTEEILWDFEELPYKTYPNSTLALPYLSYSNNSFEDLISRIYWIYRLDSAYFIRQDIENIISEIEPYFENSLELKYKNTSNYATRISRFIIKYVKPPLVGQKQPSEIRAEISLNFAGLSEDQISEWNNLQPGEPLFLISFNLDNKSELVGPNFQAKYRIKAVRGCELSQMYTDSENKRILNVFLDPFQYKQDSENENQLIFNLVIRGTKKNNGKFLSILKMLRELMKNREKLLPEFIKNSFVKNTNFNEISEPKMPNNEILIKILPFLVTDSSEFSSKILNNSLISHKIRTELSKLAPDLKFSTNLQFGIKPTDEQIAAIIGILSKQNENISVITGGPNSGKTNTGLILANSLILSDPQERILFFAENNESLKEAFKKLEKQGIVNERYIAVINKYGKCIVNGKDLSKKGRVDYLLTQRLINLHYMKELANTISISKFENFTCESALSFFNTTILKKWEEFLTNLQIEKGTEGAKNDAISRFFPFKQYFEQQAGKPIFSNEYDSDLKIANQKWDELLEIKRIIQETHIFEIIRNDQERENYILTSHAKIIGITSDFAVANLQNLLKLHINYSTIIFDNSGNCPFWKFILLCTLSQKLRKMIIIGDSCETPKYNQNEAFRKKSNLLRSVLEICDKMPFEIKFNFSQIFEVSPKITKLYEKNYDNLKAMEEKINGNPGFLNIYQWIDVEEKGMEIEGNNQIINISEAEFITAVFLYMILQGYNENEIGIMTMTNEQSELIKEILTVKGIEPGIIKELPFIGKMSKYAGVMKKYLLVSVGRQKTLGPFKDPKRLVYITTRAMNGIYLFGNSKLFEKVGMNINLIKHLTCKPLNLLVVPIDKNPSDKKSEDTPPSSTKPISGYEEMYLLVNEIIKNQTEMKD